MAVLGVLLEVTIYSWLLFLIIITLKRILKGRISARLQYLIWFLLIARLCIPITVDTGVHLFIIPKSHTSLEQAPHNRGSHTYKYSQNDISLEQYTSRSSLNHVERLNKLKNISNQRNEILHNQPIPAIQHNSTIAKSTIEIKWQLVIFGIWILGIAGVLSFLTATAIKMNRVIGSSKVTVPKWLVSMTDECSEGLNIKRTINPYLVEHITTPALTISPKPKLLLPAYMIEDMTLEQISFAIRHELTHYRRKDHLVSLLLRVLECIYWFNPVVWIMSKEILMDMESACDNQVVQDMSRSEKRNYAITILELSSQNRKPQFALGMGLSGTRDVVEGRIRSIYENIKMETRTKLVLAILISILIFSCFTTACRPTPEKPIVIGKGDGNLEKIISGNAPTPKKPYVAPSKLDYSLEGVKDFSVEIDANVVIPNIDAYPVVSAERDTITQEQADKIMKVLLQGGTLYKPDPTKNKAQIKNRINYYQEELETSNTEELRGIYREKLKELMKEYDVAPEEVELVPAQTEFAFLEDFPQLVMHYGKEVEYKFEWTEEGRKKAQEDGNLAIMGITPFELGKRQMHLTIKKSNDNRENYVYFEEYDDSWLHSYPCADKTTLEEATEQAQQWIEEMGLDFSMISAKTYDSSDREIDPEDADEPWNNQSWHEFVFMRRINGVSQSSIASARIFNEVDYAYPYRGESIRLLIDNDGIVHFDWRDPSRLIDTENTNVPVLPFDGIKEIFDEQIMIQNQWSYTDEDVISRRLVIDHVELSYMPIRRANDQDTYIYVPVWDFCGKLIAKYGEDYPAATPDHYILDENNERVEIGSTDMNDQGTLSFLTINAVDGSIIDRNRGY